MKDQGALASRAQVLLVCSGLDHAHRGFESFARECFEALRGEPGLQIALVKGSGPRAASEWPVPTLRRDRLAAKVLARVVGARSFRVEALSFSLSLQPLLARSRPDVVYLSEWDTARGLAAMRQMMRQRFKLVLCNGTLVDRGFDHLDRVQDLTPAAHEWVLARGADPRRHRLLPLGFEISRDYAAPTATERRKLRGELRLPRDRRIILSVAALNSRHKRLNYLIEEVAALPAPRPFLLLAGEPDEETPRIRRFAHERLGEQGHSIRTVPAAEIQPLYRASDVFVLASLWEGLPRALIEACAAGLPCLVHDYAVTEFALGDGRLAADFRQRGALTDLLSGLLDPDLAPSRAAARHRYVYEHFSWDRLRPRYVQLLSEAAHLDLPAGG